MSGGIHPLPHLPSWYTHQQYNAVNHKPQFVSVPQIIIYFYKLLLFSETINSVLQVQAQPTYELLQSTLLQYTILQ